MVIGFLRRRRRRQEDDVLRVSTPPGLYEAPIVVVEPSFFDDLNGLPVAFVRNEREARRFLDVERMIIVVAINYRGKIPKSLGETHIVLVPPSLTVERHHLLRRVEPSLVPDDEEPLSTYMRLAGYSVSALRLWFGLSTISDVTELYRLCPEKYDEHAMLAFRDEIILFYEKMFRSIVHPFIEIELKRRVPDYVGPVELPVSEETLPIYKCLSQYLDGVEVDGSMVRLRPL